MTDLEKFTKLVKEFGIFDNLREGHDAITTINDRTGNTEVNFWAGAGSKVLGYDQCYSVWSFTPEGEFVGIETFE